MWKTTSESYLELAQQIPSKELSALLEVSDAITSSLDFAEVMQIAITSATKLLGLETGAIYTLENGMLQLGATTPPLPPEFPDDLRLANLDDHPHISQAISTKAPVHLDDTRVANLSPAERVVVDSRQLISILYVPLLHKQKSIGAFIVGTTSEIHQFQKHELAICTIFSRQASLAVANAKLHRKAQQSIVAITQAYDATLEGWSRLLDIRDQMTDKHTHRVVDLTANLARRLGTPEAKLVHIQRGALLHDIGKMGIPDSILHKPGLLTDREWKIMRTHPLIAYQILSDIDYLSPALDIPYCHHEKWDGTGYPRELKGDAIPISARIFAVIDVFDALTSDRPYRKAWKRVDAFAYIRKQSGKHFYPEAVTEFMAMMGQ
jgi:HD-GYP domain-containing protein (c-di-GMP phosphodiesterase class II)